ncbi:MAG: hypothetical protein R2834_01630 [Rhodothermales bacterium]
MTRLLLLAALLAPSLSAFAQNADTSRTILPDISPREVEILGQLEISFPSLQRQPLIGFNPPPRVPEVPSSRVPLTENYKQAKADLPGSTVSKPEPPRVSFLGDVQPLSGELEASAGRYLSRLLVARMNIPVTRRTSFYAQVDYEGTEGNLLSQDDAFSELKNPYDVSSGELGLRRMGPRFAYGLGLDGAVAAYTLFGTNLLQAGGYATPIVLPNRNGRMGAASLWLKSQSETRAALDLKLTMRGTRFSTELFDNNLEPLSKLQRTENRAEWAGKLDIPFSLGSVLLQTDASAAGIDAFFSRDVLYDFNFGTGLRLDLAKSFRVTLLGRFLGFSDVEGELQSYATGDLLLDLYPGRGVHIYAHNRPDLMRNRLWDLYQVNPFMVDRPELQASLRPINAVAGFDWFAGVFQMGASGGYEYIPNYQFFEGESDPATDGYNYRRGIFPVFYDEVEIYHAGGTVSLVFPFGLQTEVGATYRDGRFKDSNSSIPYFSPVEGRGMISYLFNKRKTLVQWIGTYHSPRYRSRFEEVKVDDYLELDFVVSHKINPGLALIMRANNVLGSDLEYWEHYPESPFTLSAGLRVLW